MREQRLLVVGGGILGTMHAWVALQRGWSVTHLERDPEPRGASVRNFGLVWVSGRAPGAELALALQAREGWESIARACPGTGFRANGSLTVARTPAEVAVLEEVLSRPDAPERRLRLLTRAELRREHPALGGRALAALHCAADAAVEPRDVLGALRQGCGQQGRYTWLPGREVIDVGEDVVVDRRGDRHQGDLVVFCPGAAAVGLVAELLADAPLRRVRLQMLETEPLEVELGASVADGDSLRYYPAFVGAAREALPPQDAVAAAWAAQLLMVQRRDGGLTIGDTHRVEEPFPFDVDEAPTRHLLAVAEALLGRPPPRVARRWAGTYSQRTDEGAGACYLRSGVPGGAQVVTGAGGRGMTLAPAIAEETFA